MEQLLKEWQEQLGKLPRIWDAEAVLGAFASSDEDLKVGTYPLAALVHLPLYEKLAADLQTALAAAFQMAEEYKQVRQDEGGPYELPFPYMASRW